MEKSNRTNVPNVPMSETGTASSGIIVARQLCKNTNMTSTTSSSASTKV